MNCLKQEIPLERDRTRDRDSITDLKACAAEGRKRYSLPARQFRMRLQEEGTYRRSRRADSNEDDNPPRPNGLA